jgi:hypothetical protein
MLDPMTLTAFAAAALLTAAVGLVWQSRARAGRRQTVLNAYAEREIARLRGGGPAPSTRRREKRSTQGGRRPARGWNVPVG